jgi:hypothetical protein
LKSLKTSIKTRKQKLSGKNVKPKTKNKRTNIAKGTIEMNTLTEILASDE